MHCAAARPPDEQLTSNHSLEPGPRAKGAWEVATVAPCTDFQAWTCTPLPHRTGHVPQTLEMNTMEGTQVTHTSLPSSRPAIFDFWQDQMNGESRVAIRAGLGISRHRHGEQTCILPDGRRAFPDV